MAFAYIVLLIIGSILISIGLIFSLLGMPTRLFLIMVGAALFYASHSIFEKMYAGEAPKEESKPQPDEAKASILERRFNPEVLLNRKYLVFNVAGVTYKNDDKTSRQAILRELYKNGETIEEDDDEFDDEFDDDDNGREYPLKRAFTSIEIEDYEYEGKTAYHILCGNKCIGNVPADKVSKVTEILDYDLDAFINVGKFHNEDDKLIYFAEMHFSYQEPKK